MTVFNDTVKAAIEYTASGTTMIQTLWFRNLAEFGQSEVEDLALELDEWASVNFVPNLHQSVIYQGLTIYDMRSPDSFMVYNNTSAPQAGGSTGNAASLASAMTITFITNRIGRSYRGRNYVSGWDEALVGNKEFITQALDDMQGAYDALPAKALAAGFTHVVASRVQGGVVLEVGVTTPIIAYRPNARIYKQGERTK